MLKNVYAHQIGSDHSALGWTTWSPRPDIILFISALGILYFLAYRRIRSKRSPSGKTRYIFYFYYLGCAVLLLALISPIDTLSDSLAWVHMLQHTLILMVAAPLMALGGPYSLAPRVLAPKTWKLLGPLGSWLLRGRGGISRFFPPLLIWLLYSLTLWIWHIPKLYEAAMAKEWLHDLQHIAFFVTAYFFWRLLFDPFRENLRPLVGILYAFIASLHGIILGVLMALSPTLWYDSYRYSPYAFGLTPMEDQQMAGLIMWMPAGLAYVGVSIYLIVSLLKRGDLKESPSPSKNR